MTLKKQKETQWQVTNSNILTSNPPPNGFIVGGGDLLYACVPCGKKLMIIHQGCQLKICNNETSARNFIMKHQKRRKK